MQVILLQTALSLWERHQHPLLINDLIQMQHLHPSHLLVYYPSYFLLPSLKIHVLRSYLLPPPLKIHVLRSANSPLKRQLAKLQTGKSESTCTRLVTRAPMLYTRTQALSLVSSRCGPVVYACIHTQRRSRLAHHATGLVYTRVYTHRGALACLITLRALCLRVFTRTDTL